MGASFDDEFDSGDDLFDSVLEEDLLVQQPGEKRDRGHESELLPLASSAKKPRHGPDDGSRDALQLAQRILQDKFGYASFRHEQEAAIRRLLGGDNTLVVFPTGAGKSLCYQVKHIHLACRSPFLRVSAKRSH